MHHSSVPHTVNMFIYEAMPTPPNHQQVKSRYYWLTLLIETSEHFVVTTPSGWSLFQPSGHGRTINSNSIFTS